MQNKIDIQYIYIYKMTWNEEEMQRLKKENYKEYRKRYKNEKMKTYPWYCDVCNNGKNYLLRGKFEHCKSKKHQRNYYMQQPLIEL